MARRIAVAVALALTALPGLAVVTVPGSAEAQGCVGVGRRVVVSQCNNPAPPPAYYAPLPEDVPPPPPPPPPTTCVGYNGRWVHTSNCH